MHADPDDLGKGIMVKFGCKTVCLLHLGFHCSLGFITTSPMSYIYKIYDKFISVLTNLTSMIQ